MIAVLFPFAPACALFMGCLADLEDRCLSDADCPEGASCVRLDGFMTCRPGGGAGGDGGWGGWGGGGTGGTGSTGGSGGEGGTGGVEGFDAEIEIRIEPDEALKGFLGVNQRELGGARVRYELDGMERVEEVHWEEPSPRLGQVVSFGLRLPAERQPLRFEVEVEALLLDRSPAVFAAGEVVGEVVAGQKADLVAPLELAATFDFDGDEDPDATDCEPNNGERHHATYDVCDGVQQACSPRFCFIPLDEGQTVRDLACSVSKRRCAAALADGETGAVRIHASNFPSAPLAVGGIANPLGVAWNEADGHLMVVSRRAVNFVNTEGTILGGRVSLSKDASGKSVISRHGDYAVVAAENEVAGLVFDPSSVVGKNINCDQILLPQCKSVSFAGLKETGGSAVAVGALVESLAMFHPNSSVNPLVYLRFSNESRIGAGKLNQLNLVSNDSGLLPGLGDATPRALELTGAGKLVLAGRGVSGEGVGGWLHATEAANDHQAFEPFDLPEGSCPAALDANRSEGTLLMADDCTGSLWELPLDGEGKPKGEDFVHHPLTNCERPFALASLPANETEGPLTFVGCEGENHILVYGRY